MTRIFATSAICLFAIAAAAEPLPRELPSRRDDRDRLRQQLAAIVRPRADFNDATRRSVLDFVRQTLKPLGTTLHTPIDHELTRITLSAQQVSQLRLLDEICAAMDWYWRFTPDGVEMGPKSFLEAL